MICYFDKDNEVNLSHLEHIKSVRTATELKKRLKQFEFSYSRQYDRPGIYFVEVSKIPELWCAKTFPNSFNLFLNIPSHVILAAKNKKLRIIILSIVEGDNFTTETFDGFFHLHGTVRLLGLPKNSVCIVSGNLNANRQYIEWCLANSKEPCIEFLEGVEWDGKESNQIEIPIQIKDYSLPFNSLNRAHRNHRSEHLYFLAENKLQGLVSGGSWFHTGIPQPVYQTVNFEHYKNILMSNYPKHIDVNDLINNVPNLINNLEIYENSQLSVVTESHFNQDGGLFITEKTFRPILLGHPFMILGQHGLLSKLREWGFQTKFEGLDQTYDEIKDAKERFLSFHQSLRTWCTTDPEIRRTMTYKWNNVIKHNFIHYKRINFKDRMFDNVIASTEKYFTEVFRNSL